MQSTYGSSGASQELDARDAATTVVDRGWQAADAVQRTTEDAYNTAKRTVQDQPALTMLGVFAFGVVFGAVLMGSSLMGSSRRPSGYDRFMGHLQDYVPSQSQFRNWRRRHNF